MNMSMPAISDRIREISDLPKDGLRQAWSSEFGREPPVDFARDLLVRTLAWRIQEKARGGAEGESLGHSEIVQLRWARKPFPATKGVALAPSESLSEAEQHYRGVLLRAIGKARLWVEEMMGQGTIRDIAKREGKGERQIRLLLRLAFTPPNLVRELVAGTVSPVTVTELAKTVPLVWP